MSSPISNSPKPGRSIPTLPIACESAGGGGALARAFLGLAFSLSFLGLFFLFFGDPHLNRILSSFVLFLLNDIVEDKQGHQDHAATSKHGKCAKSTLECIDLYVPSSTCLSLGCNTNIGCTRESALVNDFDKSVGRHALVDDDEDLFIAC